MVDWWSNKKIAAQDLSEDPTPHLHHCFVLWGVQTRIGLAGSLCPSAPLCALLRLVVAAAAAAAIITPFYSISSPSSLSHLPFFINTPTTTEASSVLTSPSSRTAWRTSNVVVSKTMEERKKPPQTVAPDKAARNASVARTSRRAPPTVKNPPSIVSHQHHEQGHQGTRHDEDSRDAATNTARGAFGASTGAPTTSPVVPSPSRQVLAPLGNSSLLSSSSSSTTTTTMERRHPRQTRFLYRLLLLLRHHQSIGTMDSPMRRSPPSSLLLRSTQGSRHLRSTPRMMPVFWNPLLFLPSGRTIRDPPFTRTPKFPWSSLFPRLLLLQQQGLPSICSSSPHHHHLLATPSH